MGVAADFARGRESPKRSNSPSSLEHPSHASENPQATAAASTQASGFPREFRKQRDGRRAARQRTLAKA